MLLLFASSPESDLPFTAQLHSPSNIGAYWCVFIFLDSSSFMVNDDLPAIDRGMGTHVQALLYFNGQEGLDQYNLVSNTQNTLPFTGRY